MAIQALNTIKNWFRTALKPTQGQFWDTWDSFWHKSDTIPTSVVDGLDGILSTVITTEILDNTVKNLSILTSTSPFTYTIPEGRLLDQIVVETILAQSLTLETIDGLKDIADDDSIDANGFGTYVVNLYGKASKEVIFKMAEEITIKLYLR